MRYTVAVALAVLTFTATGATASANPDSGVDAALFRPSIDTGGVFSLEGARLMPKYDLSWKTLVEYSQNPFRAAVPGICPMAPCAGDTGVDTVLSRLITVDMTFALAFTSKLEVGFDVAAYRTSTGAGYGVRGRFESTGDTPSTGLISLRPLSNIDPSGGFTQEGLAGPLDVRVVAKYALVTQKNLAVTLMGSASAPFGNDEMFLGDSGFVLEPRLLLDYRMDQVHATKLVANVGVRLRHRTVLEAYDPGSQTMDQAAVVADVGSEATAGAGFVYELNPSLIAAAEAMAFLPLPTAITLGDCTRNSGAKCSTITSADYFAGGSAGDLAAYANVGAGYRASPHVTIDVMGGAGLVGKRKDDFPVIAGLTWSPQPKGVAEAGRGDRDGDGIPDVSDACPDDAEDKDGYQDEDGCPDVDNDGDGVVDANDACPNDPEDRDGFQDADGCPDRDNDNDGITDVVDRCPDQAEDFDGFEDDDGCPDDDNDGDGFPDKTDKCPNDPETVNGFQDEDGCPDSRVNTGPEEGKDRIDLKGNKIAFTSATSATLTGASKQILDQVAQLIKDKKLVIRIEVRVPLGTKSKSKAAIKKQKAKDKDLSQRRAQAIYDYLVSKQVPNALLADPSALGSDRPIGNNVPTDPANERVDFIKAQQRSP